MLYPSNHTKFLNYDESAANRRRQYTQGTSKETTYQADTGLSYSKAFGNHIIAANANWKMSASTSSSLSTIGEGFGEGSKADMAFAMQYPLGSRPIGSSNNQREIGVVGAVNYSYADRYLFDASARMSGSYMFGAENKWGLFWSLGAGWNIHNEAFAQNAQWLDFFKVHGSVFYGFAELRPISGESYI